jgi:hypothetical protein
MKCEKCFLTVRLVTPDDEDISGMTETFCSSRTSKEKWPYKPAGPDKYTVRISRGSEVLDGEERTSIYKGCLTPGEIAIDFPAAWLRRASYHMPPQDSMYDEKTKAEKNFEAKKAGIPTEKRGNFHFAKKFWYGLEEKGTDAQNGTITGITMYTRQEAGKSKPVRVDDKGIEFFLKEGENYIVIELQSCLLPRDKGEKIRDKTVELWEATKTPYALSAEKFDDENYSIKKSRAAAVTRLEELAKLIKPLNEQIDSDRSTPGEREIAREKKRPLQKEAELLNTDLERYDNDVAEARARAQYAGPGAQSGKSGDCSGTTWVSYKEAGVPYGKYMFTGAFHKRIRSNDLSFPFKEIPRSKVQPGDIYLFTSHMAIHDNIVNGKENMLTAHDIRGEYRVMPNSQDNIKRLSLYKRHYTSENVWNNVIAVLRYYCCIEEQ